MTNYDASMNYYTPVRSRSTENKKLVGGVLGGGLLGMTAYYLPVAKDTFVEKAFDIHRNNVNSQICALKTAVTEVEADKVSPTSKMVLQAHGLSEDVVQINDKCISLDKSICDESAVKTYKQTMEQSFDVIKKQAGMRDNVATEALRAVKRTHFHWGIGIGAAAGLALSLLGSRDKY